MCKFVRINQRQSRRIVKLFTTSFVIIASNNIWRTCQWWRRRLLVHVTAIIIILGPNFILYSSYFVRIITFFWYRNGSCCTCAGHWRDFYIVIYTISICGARWWRCRLFKQLPFTLIEWFWCGEITAAAAAAVTRCNWSGTIAATVVICRYMNGR